jgi:hypothetical protein
MVNRITDYLKDIRTQETEKDIDPYWIDDLIISISTNDGDASSVSTEDVEAYLSSSPPDVDQYASYKSADALTGDIGCYLTARYMSYANKHPYALAFGLDETTPWVKSYYDNTCTPSNLGRLFSYSYEAAPEITTKKLFPRKIAVARSDKVRSWMKLGWRWETSVPQQTEEIQPAQPETKPASPGTVKRGRKTQWIPATSRDGLLALLKSYPDYPKELRHEMALKVLAALRNLLSNDDGIGRIKGIGELVSIIADEEKKAGFTRYSKDVTDVKSQLDVKGIYRNIRVKSVDIDAAQTKFFSFHPTTFMGRVIDYWGRIGYLEPGDSEILMRIIGYVRRGDSLGQFKKIFAIKESFDPSSQCMAIKALGNMAYIDSREKEDVADYLKSFINNETSKTDWYKGDNLRLVFEAVVSLGKLGLTRVHNKSIVKFLHRFLYSPLHKKVDPDLGWINFAGLRALTHLYDSASGAEKKLIYRTILSDGLSHPVDYCRIYSYAFLTKIRRRVYDPNSSK